MRFKTLSYSHFLFWDETLIEPINTIYKIIDSFYSKHRAKYYYYKELNYIEILFQHTNLLLT